MKYLKGIFKICLAFILVLLDVTFFVNFQVLGATFLSSFAVLIIFALIDDPKSYYIYLFSLILFFTAFSSLPIIIIYLNFLALPLFISFMRKNFFSEPTIAISTFYFLFSAFAFEFSLLIYSSAWSKAGYLALFVFVVMNTVFAIFIYSVIQKMRRDLVSAKVKL